MNIKDFAGNEGSNNRLLDIDMMVDHGIKRALAEKVYEATDKVVNETFAKIIDEFQAESAKRNLPRTDPEIADFLIAEFARVSAMVWVYRYVADLLPVISLQQSLVMHGLKALGESD